MKYKAKYTTGNEEVDSSLFEKIDRISIQGNSKIHFLRPYKIPNHREGAVFYAENGVVLIVSKKKVNKDDSDPLVEVWGTTRNRKALISRLQEMTSNEIVLQEVKA